MRLLSSCIRPFTNFDKMLRRVSSRCPDSGKTIKNMQQSQRGVNNINYFFFAVLRLAFGFAFALAFGLEVFLAAVEAFL